ncbi:hypothetical protein [Nitriliruptor alkaliphilus]|uniref:hypothetical protein n=1 Tax=Nitriliruptor alkaliphilus TaxID=427918 RepID=UPI000695F4AA|nr:hypothetical protein [Nitriliruptor alkaliphilus]
MNDDDALTYPTDQVVGVLDDPSALDGLLDRLGRADVSADRTTVLRGAGDADLAPDPSEGGPVTRIVRAAQKVLGDEAERLNVLDEALEAGGVVVGVEVATPDDDEDARDRELADLAAAFRSSGARDVAFYGEYQIQQLDAAGT